MLDRAVIVAVMPVSLFAATFAHAALGSFPLSGGSAHVQSAVLASPRAAISARSYSASGASSANSGATSAYSVNTVTLESGTVVREFVAKANNLVFAVAWTGPRLPNLDVLLGSYFSRFSKAKLSDPGLHSAGPSQRGLSSSDLVVQSYGHAGDFQGYAYLPAAVPSGVSLSDIR
ncbi:MULTISPECIES: DUF2844 domain-containing protein [Paraburkholderia]|uniref:DUF2844 domain-containing protein n=1 Tax=Paraburkholderia madseniana TaxID=2599607 RepID=A0AAP5ESQ6_9BURK|nr:MULTISPECIES: DUF2844 domain-containing protein [Paraburkholderia]MCX4151687.1 DUF2844 domain-containing protein [Paraburkholderia madseniana]MCX4176962.1 DUF2844 domain-containing protein [Paraburkholderia madseniana]MDN7154615.1 DUF2844 domain-containing protein [Paraburkholderia sp. WS6]MDQ6413498.1 DUF2844 domain-containing protein [Paraburkholderia madseniana]MDQ6464952.1 DUF2844 domain-containing protein [Paraburkholderia madseniana]